MSRLYAVALGPHVEMPPRKDFTKLPAAVSLAEAWKIVGPSVEMNIGRAPLWQVIASAYVEGVMHGAGRRAVPGRRSMSADKLKLFIETRDRRCAKASGYQRAPISEHFERLMRGETVRVGGRASCGPKVDASWVEFTAWNEVVRKATTVGLRIEQTPVKHGNGWATKGGGFWNENDYRLETTNAS